MGKWVADQVLDGALQIISGADRMVALSGQPATFSAAWDGRLAEASVGASDFAVQPGVASGRRVLVSGKSAVAVRASATADHVALVDTTASRLLYVTTCPAQALVVGGTVNFDGWSVEIGSPA
ncbi:MAG: hypothetical protein ACRC1J_00905 [Sandaracinobacteroides sp.]